MATMTREHTREVVEKAEEAIRELGETAESLPERSSSPWLLGAALGSIVAAVVLYGRGKKQDATFVGLWAPTILALSLFRDIIKMPKRT